MILRLRIKYGRYHDMVKKNLLRGKLGVDIKNISHKINKNGKKWLVVCGGVRIDAFNKIDKRHQTLNTGYRSTQVRSPVVPTNLMCQVCSKFNCSVTLKVK